MEEEPATAFKLKEQQDSTSQTMATNPYKGYTWEQLQEALVEKEYELECTRDSIGQLSICKGENVRKDEIIASLRKELAAYKKNSWSKDVSYVSMEERLAECESHLQEKTDEVKSLQKELEELRGQLQATVSRSTVNQKKMSSTLTTMSQQARDVQQLQSQHKTDAAQLESLRQELTEKKADMYSLQERVKRLRNMNQDLQKRLEDSQTQCENLVKNEQRLKAEVAQLKNHSSDGRLLQAKHDFVEQELTKNKEREKVMTVELGRLREELASLCENVSKLTGSGSGDDRQAPACNPTTAISAVSKLVQEHLETNSKLATVTQQLEKLETEHSILCDCIDSLQQSWTECKGVMSENPLSGVSALITKLQSLQSQNCLKDFSVTMQEVLLSVRTCSSSTSNTLSQLTEKVTASYSTMDSHDDQETDPVAMVSFMSEMVQSTVQEVKQLKQKLRESEIEHSAALSGAMTALRHDEEARLSSKVENMRQQEKVQYSHQMDKLKQEWEAEKKAAVGEVEARSKVMKAELENLKQLYEAQLSDNKLMKENLVGLESKLQDRELRQKEELTTSESQKEELRQQLFEEVTAYKEQSEQYAATIVALEEKLLELMDKCKLLQDKNTELAEKLQVEATTCQREVKGRAEEVQKMDLLISTLKKQFSLVAKENVDRQSRIKQLQGDLEAIERERKESEEQLKSQNKAEVTDLRLMLSSQEATIECQKDEGQKLKELLSERTSQLSVKEENFQRTTEELESLKLGNGPLGSTRLHNTDLSEAGQQCLGEKHKYLIAKQRGVIAQLKQRISDLEHAKPPVGSHQATLKELSRVRHELLKARADSKSLVQQEKPDVDCTKTLLSYQVAAEPRDKGKEKHALQQSEKSYIHLVNTICQQLPEVEKPVLSDLTTDSELKDRLELLKERKQFADSVSKQLKIVQGCSAGSRQSDEGSVSLDEQRPAEVIAQLESLLSATAEELEQQRRLNQALIKRKNFKENQVK